MELRITRQLCISVSPDARAWVVVMSWVQTIHTTIFGCFFGGERGWQSVIG
jgi:hypothetical protein